MTTCLRCISIFERKFRAEDEDEDNHLLDLAIFEPQRMLCVLLAYRLFDLEDVNNIDLARSGPRLVRFWLFNNLSHELGDILLCFQKVAQERPPRVLRLSLVNVEGSSKTRA